MKSKILIGFISLVLLVTNPLFSSSVYGQEYTVSGNGDGSESQISVAKDNFAQVSQSNGATINNDVTSTSNTGNNTASDNNSQTAITTGDSKQTTQVETAVNTNQAQTGCCLTDSSSKASVTDNGANSNNQINYNQKTTTAITQNNTVSLNNNIKVSANTGNNQALDNTGDVTVKTGDISIQTGVTNNGNNSYTSTSKPQEIFNLKIAGNGSGSTSDVENTSYESRQFLMNNYLNLSNNITANANTGGNRANNNKGRIFISTGSVLLDIILNTKANTSTVIADCSCNEKSPSPTPTPTPSSSPSTTPSGGGNNGGGGGNGSGGSGGGSSSSGSSSSTNSSGSGGSGGGGEVLGVSLPATGGFSIYTVTILALILLILGIILRIDYAKIKSFLQCFNYNFAVPVVIYLLAFCKSLSLSRQAQLAREYAFYFHPQNQRLRAFG